MTFNNNEKPLTGINKSSSICFEKLTLADVERIGWKWGKSESRHLFGGGFRSSGRWRWLHQGNYPMSITKCQLQNDNHQIYQNFHAISDFFSHKWILCLNKFCPSLSNNIHKILICKTYVLGRYMSYTWHVIYHIYF